MEEPLAFGSLYHPVADNEQEREDNSNILSNESSVESVEGDYFIPSPAGQVGCEAGPSATSTQSIDFADTELLGAEKLAESTMLAVAGFDVTLTTDNADQMPMNTGLDVVDLPPRMKSIRKLSRGRMVRGSKPSINVIKAPLADDKGEYIDFYRIYYCELSSHLYLWDCSRCSTSGSINQ